MATRQKLSLPVVDAPQPPVTLTDLYNAFSTMGAASGGELWQSVYQHGPSDPGIFEIREGRLYCALDPDRMLSDAKPLTSVLAGLDEHQQARLAGPPLCI